MFLIEHVNDSVEIAYNYMNFIYYRKTSANVKTAYKRNYLNTEGDIDLSVTGPVFNGSTVFM